MRHRLAAFLATVALAGSPAAAEQLVHGGAPRTFELHVPASVTAARAPVPLVVVLHGGNGSGRQVRGFTGFDAVAEHYGLVAAYPDGVDKGWNDGRAAVVGARHKGNPPNDVGFLTALVADLVARGIADPARVYVTGASNGGMMTFRLACETSGVFAGYAAVVANFSTELAAACAPKGGVRMLMINGTADTFVPYAGGAVVFKRGTVIPTEETFAFWAKAAGCQPPVVAVRLPDLDPKDGSAVDVIGCPGRAALYRIVGGGHQWPTRTRVSRPMIDRVLGPRNADFDASDHIWRFFDGKL